MSEQYDSTKAKRVAKYKKEAERDSYPKITKDRTADQAVFRSNNSKPSMLY